MSLAELKLEIIKKIIATNDEVLLNKILEILESDNTNLLVNEPSSIYKRSVLFSDEEVKNKSFLEDELYVFTPEQRKRVLNSLEQSKKGNTMTDEEAEADIQKWL